MNVVELLLGSQLTCKASYNEIWPPLHASDWETVSDEPVDGPAARTTLLIAVVLCTATQTCCVLEGLTANIRHFVAQASGQQLDPATQDMVQFPRGIPWQKATAPVQC